MCRILITFAVAAASLVLLAACGESDGADPRSLIVYEAETDNVTNIFTIDAETGETTQITDATDFDGNPAWSPDRKRIVFSSRGEPSEKYDLYVMDADGTNRKRLTQTPDAGELSPRFSPDGRRIAFVSQTNEGWTVQVMAADGSDPQQAAGTFAFAEFPAWTRDGGELFFAAIEQNDDNAGAFDLYAATGENDGPHIYSVDLESLEVTMRIKTAGIDVCPHITADGERLLYASTMSEDNDKHVVFVHDIASDDTSGASDIPLTEPGERNDYPDPAPDGASIVFASSRDGNVELYVMDADGSNERRLTTTPDTRENVPDW